MTTPFDVDEIWDKVSERALPSEPDKDSCWPWPGSLTSSGYGKVSWYGMEYLVHRIAYQALVGDVPDGLELDHLCRVRSCFNPSHLEAVTHRENVLRGVSFAAVHSQLTHCRQGHEFTPENTYVTTQGARRCRTCKAAHQRSRRQP